MRSGLIQWTAALYDADDGGLIHPLRGSRDVEQRLGDRARETAVALLPEKYEYRAGEDHDLITPVLSHIPVPTVRGGLSVVYRAITPVYRDWFSRTHRVCEARYKQYQALTGQSERPSNYAKHGSKNAV